MSANLQAKIAVADEIRGKFEKAESAVLVDYVGMTVEEVTALRSEFRKVGVDFKVYKNTMIQKATADQGLDDLVPYLNGSTAVAFSYENPTAAAKVLADFIKKTKKTEMKCAVVGGKVFDKAGCEALANIPSREVLIAQLMSVFNGPVQSFTVAVNALREKLENGAAAEA